MKTLFSLSEARVLSNLEITSWERDFSSSRLKEKKSLVGTQELNNSRKTYIGSDFGADTVQLFPCFFLKVCISPAHFMGLTAKTINKSAKNFIKMREFIKTI